MRALVVRLRLLRDAFAGDWEGRAGYRGRSASRPTAGRPTPWAGQRLPTDTALPGAAPAEKSRSGGVPEICAGLLAGASPGLGPGWSSRRCWMLGRWCRAGILAYPGPRRVPLLGVLPLLRLAFRYLVGGVRQPGVGGDGSVHDAVVPDRSGY